MAKKNETWKALELESEQGERPMSFTAESDDGTRYVFRYTGDVTHPDERTERIYTADGFDIVRTEGEFDFTEMERQ
jgi:hypothetical protein